MGRDKLHMPLPETGKSLITRSIEVLQTVFPKVVCAAKQPLQGVSVESIVDPPGLEGPIAGVISGLRRFNEPLFVMSADMPEVTSEAIRWICERHTHPRIERLVVRGSRGVEPLFGIYFPSILGCLERRVAAGYLSLQKLPIAEQIVSREQMMSAGVLSSWGLRSLNTPEELQEYTSRTVEILAE